MPSFVVRPFRRADRDQLARLVNRHAAAVMPGASMSINTVLSQLEREPAEFIVDPWVAERVTMVAEQSGTIVAAALLVRYGDDETVGEAYRNVGEIRWLLFWPLAPSDNPHWHDGHAAADALLVASLELFDTWGVARSVADGSLPHPGVYGVPSQWPHIEGLYRRHGFQPTGPTEIILLADLDRIEQPGSPPIDGLTVNRLVGLNGTRFSAQLGDEAIGAIEVDLLDPAERHQRHEPLADVGNLYVSSEHQRQGVGTWLMGHAAAWLRLGHTDRLIAYAWPEEAELLAFLTRHGFVEVTRTAKGWTYQPEPASAHEPISRPDAAPPCQLGT